MISFIFTPVFDFMQILPLKAEQKRTSRALFIYHFLGEPLWTVYGYIPFIMRNDLDATTWQITLLTMLKPLVSVFSFYWSENFRGKQSLRSSLLIASGLSKVFFLLVPFIYNSWFFILISAFYMLFSRAASPVWMQVLKLNLPENKRGRVFSWSFSLSYLEGALLSWGIGSLLTQNPALWKGLFFMSALVGLLSLFFLVKMPILEPTLEPKKAPRRSFKERLLEPWKNAYYLIKTRPDFALFQWGFMLCGFGLMIAYPAIPLLLIDTLQFNTLEYGLATNACKGIFIVLSSPLWGRFLQGASLFSASSLIFWLTGVFLSFLLVSLWNPVFAYIGFCFYGLAQGGSHLLWHFSGVLFSGKEDSIRYSGINVMMVGIRGTIGPLLGGIISAIWSPFFALFLGIACCVISGLVTFRKKVAESIS